MRLRSEFPGANIRNVLAIPSLMFSPVCSRNAARIPGRHPWWPAPLSARSSSSRLTRTLVGWEDRRFDAYGRTIAVVFHASAIQGLAPQQDAERPGSARL